MSSKLNLRAELSPARARACVCVRACFYGEIYTVVSLPDDANNQRQLGYIDGVQHHSQISTTEIPPDAGPLIGRAAKVTKSKATRLQM